ncbi:MAG: M23 family metallopeptidase [Dehalococcoidia bacterium]
MDRLARTSPLRLLLPLLVICSSLMVTQIAQGHQQYGSNTAAAWRVPWRAGTDQWRSGYGFNTVTHIGSESYALDFSHPHGTPIHAMASGSAAAVTGSLCDTTGFGISVQLSHPGPFYSRYAHLSQNFFGVGTNIVQGQFIGRSGNSGQVDPDPPSCNTPPNGAHLHFAVYNQLSCTSSTCAVNPQSGGKTLSGYTNFDTSEGAHAHRSDNAGVGDICLAAPGTGNQCTNASALDSGSFTAFVNAYNSGGGQGSVGQPWNPCGGASDTTITACWWVHSWGNGKVQDFSGPSHGHGPGTGAIMRRTGTSTAYWVHGGVWQRYLVAGGAPGYLGYPICNEFPWSVYRRTDFQNGFVAYRPDTGESVDAAYSGFFPKIC